MTLLTTLRNGFKCRKKTSI